MTDAHVDGSMPVWVCPRCGARLVTRNMWHSCGEFTLEQLFAGAAPDMLDLAGDYVAVLRTLGDVQVIPQKTRLVCLARVRFVGLYLRKRDFLASFAQHRWLNSPRMVKRDEYGPRSRAHYVQVRAPTSTRTCEPGARSRMTSSDSNPSYARDLCDPRTRSALDQLVGPLM
jgi:hypothetical protein